MIQKLTALVASVTLMLLCSCQSQTLSHKLETASMAASIRQEAKANIKQALLGKVVGWIKPAPKVVKEEPIQSKESTIRARVTFYSAHEDRYGSKVSCPNTRRAKQGLTVAAHPDFAFGTKVIIPQLRGVVGDGNFVVQDRGSAVTSKKASRGKEYVFDIFVHTNAEKRQLAKKMPPYMEVRVL